jgi:hypothetical protein
VAGDIPYRIHTVRELRDGLGIENGIGCRVLNLDRFGPALVVPVESVESHLMRMAIGQINVETEAGGVVPG